MSMAKAGVRKLKRRDIEAADDGDVRSDSSARQWVMPSLLSAARVAARHFGLPSLRALTACSWHAGVVCVGV